MSKTQTPISERVRVAITEEDPVLIRELEMLERIASAGVAHVAANGRWPHWPVDRWISVLGFSGVILGGLFVAGSKWSNVERDVAEVKAAVADLNSTVDYNRSTQAQELRDLATQLRTVISAVTPVDTPRRRATPTFAPEDRFSGVDR